MCIIISSINVNKQQQKRNNGLLPGRAYHTCRINIVNLSGKMIYNNILYKNKCLKLLLATKVSFLNILAFLSMWLTDLRSQSSPAPTGSPIISSTTSSTYRGATWASSSTSSGSWAISTSEPTIISTIIIIAIKEIVKLGCIPSTITTSVEVVITTEVIA